MDFSYNQPVRIEHLGFGAIVTSNTMERMRQIILASIRNYQVRTWAEKITDYAGDEHSRAEAIWNFILNHTRFLPDPTNLEMIKTPPVFLQLWGAGSDRVPGDCDDLTILSLSLLESIGFRTALRAVSFDPDNSSDFSHIYGLVYIDKQWTPFDLVAGMKGMDLGSEPPNIVSIRDMEVI